MNSEYKPVTNDTLADLNRKNRQRYDESQGETVKTPIHTYTCILKHGEKVEIKAPSARLANTIAESRYGYANIAVPPQESLRHDAKPTQVNMMSVPQLQELRKQYEGKTDNTSKIMLAHIDEALEVRGKDARMQAFHAGSELNDVKIEWHHLTSPQGEGFQGWWLIGPDGTRNPINKRPAATKQEAQALLNTMRKDEKES